jgi:tetratricopeptide (TPR) repeat protein
MRFGNELIFDEVLAANVSLILGRLISPSLRKAIRSSGKKVENQYTYPSFNLTPVNWRENLESAGDSLKNDLGWTTVFADAALYSHSKHRASFTEITDRLYDALTRKRLSAQTEIRFRYAEFLRGTSREKEAISLYHRVIDGNPGHAEAHAALARCLYFDDDYNDALHHYKIARQLDWQAIHGYGHQEIFEEMLQRLGDWDELILLLKANRERQVDINRRFQQSDIGQKILLDLKLIKHPAWHEIAMLRYFGGDQGEEDLLVHNMSKLDELLQLVKTLPTNKQDEVGKSIFKRSWFGELRRH